MGEASADTASGAARRVTERLASFSPALLYGQLLLLAVAACSLSLAGAELYRTTEVEGLRHVALKVQVGQEQSLPTWISSALLLVAAVMASAVSMARHRRGQRAYRRRWAGLAVLLMLLSIDEAVGFHELLSPLTHRALAAAGYADTMPAFFENAWMIPVIPVLVVLGAIYLPFFLALPRRVTAALIMAGACVVAGALGAEGAGSLVLAAHGPESAWYDLIVVAEEGLELVGIATCILGLHVYLRFLTPGAVAAAAREETVDERFVLFAKQLTAEANALNQELAALDAQAPDQSVPAGPATRFKIPDAA